jgi:hypothetical protein
MTDNAALKRIAEKLRRAGANLPAPELSGTIEGSVVTGLCIALALVESEIEALADPMREVQRLGQEIEQEPVAWEQFYTPAPQLTEQEADELNIAYMSGLYDGKKKRPWVGLTDDDDIGWEEGGNLRDLVKAIQTKLKQKNGYAEEKNT